MFHVPAHKNVEHPAGQISPAAAQAQSDAAARSQIRAALTLHSWVMQAISPELYAPARTHNDKAA